MSQTWRLGGPDPEGVGSGQLPSEDLRGEQSQPGQERAEGKSLCSGSGAGLEKGQYGPKVRGGECDPEDQGGGDSQGQGGVAPKVRERVAPKVREGVAPEVRESPTSTTGPEGLSPHT